VVTREALARLPLTRKRDLIELQKKAPPFGGLNALARHKAKRVFASPGPIYELQGREIDPWRMARVLVRRRFPQRRPDPQLLLLPLHARRLHLRGRGTQARLFGIPRRHRADRAAGAGDGRPAAGRLCRHAILPAHHHREG
jgi:hypothetical protein